jgi:hypothetical protein
VSPRAADLKRPDRPGSRVIPESAGADRTHEVGKGDLMVPYGGSHG